MSDIQEGSETSSSEEVQELQRMDVSYGKACLLKRGLFGRYQHIPVENVCTRILNNRVAEIVVETDINVATPPLSLEYIQRRNRSDESINDHMHIDVVSTDDMLSIYSASDGCKTTFVLESLVDTKFLTYFKLPCNKYSYSSYFINWNKIGCSSKWNIWKRVTIIKREQKKKVLLFRSGLNVRNRFIICINNVTYLLSIYQFLEFKEFIKLMFLCKATYAIFNKRFELHRNLVMSTHSLNILLYRMIKNKKYQARVLKVKMLHRLEARSNRQFICKKFSEKYEVVLDSDVSEVEDYSNSNGSMEIEKDNSQQLIRNGYLLSRDNNIDWDMILNLTPPRENKVEDIIKNYNKKIMYGIFKVNKKKNFSVREIIMLIEYKKNYMAKIDRGNFRFNREDPFITYFFNKKKCPFEDVYFYGNKVLSYEQKVKLKYHIRRRWNLKTNFLHEYVFKHQTAPKYKGGILKIVEMSTCDLYSSFSTFLTIDKIGNINTWTLSDMNSPIPQFRGQSELMVNKKVIRPRDIHAIEDDLFIVADNNWLYSFKLTDNAVTPLQEIINVTERLCENSKIRNVIRIDNERVCVGLQKSICARINVEKKIVETCKVHENPLVKIKLFDHNTNIVLTNKSIFFDDRRMPNYVSFVNNFFIKYIEYRRKDEEPRCFADFDLTGITLCTLNSNNSMHCFDLRYNYATNYMLIEKVINDKNKISIKKHLNKVFRLKTCYNTGNYAKYGKLDGLHDNILLTPVLKRTKYLFKKKNIIVDDLITQRVITDESFIYSIIKRNPASYKPPIEIPTSALHIWRWCESKQFKSIFNYAECPFSENIYDDKIYKYENFIFDSVYKLSDAPNHIFTTYDNCNYIHSLVPPTFGMRVQDTLEDIPNFLHPTNL